MLFELLLLVLSLPIKLSIFKSFIALLMLVKLLTEMDIVTPCRVIQYSGSTIANLIKSKSYVFINKHAVYFELKTSSTFCAVFCTSK